MLFERLLQRGKPFEQQGAQEVLDAIGTMSQYLPEMRDGMALRSNDFRRAIRNCHSVKPWENVRGAHFAYEFTGKLPRMKMFSSASRYLLQIALVNTGQPSDIFKREIDCLDYSGEWPRIHASLTFPDQSISNYDDGDDMTNRAWRVRYGYRRPGLEGLATTVEKEFEGSGAYETDYFSLNPAGWGDEEDKGFVTKKLGKRWRSKFDNLDGIVNDPFTCATDRYLDRGLGMKEHFWEDGSSGLELYPATHDLSRTIIGTLPYVQRVLSQRNEGIYFPRSIYIDRKHIKLHHL